MLVTQSEAANTKCPRSRDIGADHCLAARCMAWRWHDSEVEDPDRREWFFEAGDVPDDEYEALLARFAKEEPPRPKEVPPDATWQPIETDDELFWNAGGYWVESDAGFQSRCAALRAERRGYCGLAGTPA